MIKKGCLLKSRASVARHVRMFLFPKEPKNAQTVIAKNVYAALQVNWDTLYIGNFGFTRKTQLPIHIYSRAFHLYF